jgi:hypothetical protein
VGGETERLRRVTRARLADLLRTGKDPLDVLIAIAFNDEIDVSLRIQAAAAACPFMHPKLSNQTIDSRSLHATIDAAGVVASLEQRLARLASPTPTVDVVPLLPEPLPGAHTENPPATPPGNPRATAAGNAASGHTKDN